MTTPGRIRLIEAAGILGVHPETLRRWAYAGMLEYWLIGRKRAMEFDPKDVTALDASFHRTRHEPPVT